MMFYREIYSFHLYYTILWKFYVTEFNIQTNYELKQKHKRYYENWTPYIQKLILQSNINERFAQNTHTR